MLGKIEGKRRRGRQRIRWFGSITNSRGLLKLMSVKLVMPSNHLILCHLLLLLPSVFPSIRVFSNKSALLIRWPKYRSFSFSISPSNEYSGLISFRMDWFDLLAVQGALKRLLQHQFKSSNSLALNFLYGPTFRTIHDYWKNHSLTRWTFVENCPNLLELISDFCRDTRYKISIYKLIVFPYTSNEHANTEIRNTIPFALS